MVALVPSAEGAGCQEAVARVHAAILFDASMAPDCGLRGLSYAASTSCCGEQVDSQDPSLARGAALGDDGQILWAGMQCLTIS
ncbi:hypothetical protein XarbCFBP8152_06080 [Xanthomonas arboricola]|nr:hypothetical protein XarbCFBP8152_06080 [Xanthomonas arboricola]